MLLTADDRLGRARVVLERRGLAADDLLPRGIAESWRRCLAAGLDPQQAPPLASLDAAAVRAARDQAAAVRRLALGEMENLYRQIAGTNFMIAFAAPDGMLLDTISDSSFNDTARVTSIRPGTLWAELRCGTNALGTAAQTGQAVTVHGGEHFFARYADLTCTAVPVLAADGALAGVLDASSDCRSRQQHTQALVTMAAAQIENGLFREAHGGDVIVAFHSRAEYLHTLSAGLLAMDADGLVLALNARARFLLQGLPALRGQRFGALFRTPLGVLLGSARNDGRALIEDHVGSIFAARVETLPRPSRPLLARPHAVPEAPAAVLEDARVAHALAQVQAAALRRLPILIRGETGTGKEHLARHAHAASGRRGAFIAVNCAALPDTLAEAELFGHADGAFTGARRGGAPGLVAESDGGTLFLDEIGDMKRALQAILLRLLDDWTVRPVGGGKARTVDVLLVAATNADLEQRVAEGQFRADLLYRLNTLEIALPPLRERRDFAAIARRLLQAIAPEAALSDAAAELLAGRPWPGNIRELRSVLTRLTLTDPRARIGAAAVASMAGASVAGASIAGASVAGAAPASEALAAEPAAAGLRALQAERVRAVHRALDGNIAATARRLGVSRNTIYRALRAPGAGPVGACGAATKAAR